MKEINNPRRPGASTGTEKKLLLYVEDNEDNRTTARVNLERKYHLLFAETDRIACEYFIKHGQDLAVILMDIELQDSRLNGIDLTKLIRGTLDKDKIPIYAQKVPRLKTPVIFVTAYGNQYERTQIFLAGGNDIIEKPVDFISLEMAITKCHLKSMSR